MGADPVPVQRFEGRSQADQRQGGDHREVAHVPVWLLPALLRTFCVHCYPICYRTGRHAAGRKRTANDIAGKKQRRQGRLGERRGLTGTPANEFQDRCLKPLGHPSGAFHARSHRGFQAGERPQRDGDKSADAAIKKAIWTPSTTQTPAEAWPRFRQRVWFGSVVLGCAFVPTP